MNAQIIPLRLPEARAAELSDEALLAGCVVEDPAALTVLYQRHNVGVMRFACRLLGVLSPQHLGVEDGRAP